MTDDLEELRTLRGRLFDEQHDEVDVARLGTPLPSLRNVVPGEGNNPSATISDDARNRDFASRLFGDADATEAQLPEE